jgi:hypothetical protein
MFLTQQARVKFALASLSLFLVSQVISVPAAYAASGNKQNFQLPVNSALEDPNDAASGTAGGDEPKPGTVLPPLTLSGDDPAKQASAPAAQAAEGSGEKVYKLEESRNEFVPKGPAGEDGPGIASQSVVAAPKPAKTTEKKKSKGAKDVVSNENILQKSKDVNATPLALQAPAAESLEKIDKLENGEQKQIAQLWEATLQRSPDIQFVVQKLVPSSDGAHTSTMMMRLVTSALYAGVGAFGTVMPGQSTYAMQNGAAQVLGQISGAVEGKNAKKAVLNQSELISLYQMVRNTADKMVDHYRDYKRNVVGIQRATADLEDLKAMAAESTSRPLETEYTLRKQKRDIDTLADDVHRYRQNLIDLAGSEAVDKLDQDIAREMQMLGETNIVQGNEHGNEQAKPVEQAIKLPNMPAPKTAGKKTPPTL